MLLRYATADTTAVVTAPTIAATGASGPIPPTTTQFKVRPYLLIYATLNLFVLLVMNAGALMVDTEGWVVKYSLHGLTTITEKTLAQEVADLMTNATATREAPWEVTRSFTLRAVGTFRVIMCLAYLLRYTVRSIRRPNQVHTVRTFVATAAAAASTLS